MTLGELFLGCITIVVATLVYRWQKSVDRRSALDAELRGYVVEYMRLSSELYGLLHSKWGWGGPRPLAHDAEVEEAWLRLSHIQTMIDIMGSDAISAAVKQHSQAMRLVEHGMEFLDVDRVDDERSKRLLEHKKEFNDANSLLVRTVRQSFERRLI